jgi:hypothetical protein
MEFAALAFLILIGPLSLLMGADSRVDDPRGWWPAVPRRPLPGLPEGGGPRWARFIPAAGRGDSPPMEGGLMGADRRAQPAAWRMRSSRRRFPIEVSSGMGAALPASTARAKASTISR